MKPPPYKEYPVLVSKAILLRQLMKGEVVNIIPISFYDGKKAETEAEAAAMLQKIEQDHLQGQSLHWGIEDKISKKIVGTCGYYRGFMNEIGELGCVLLPEYYDLGYMTKAMTMAIEFGFNEMGLKKIIAITSEENQPAQKLLQRLNFRLTFKEEKQLHYELLAEEK